MAQITVRLDLRSWKACDGGMAWYIYIIGDDSRGGIGDAGASGKHRHSVGNAEREASPAPAAGRNAADKVLVLHLGVTEERWLVGPVDQADAEGCAFRHV